MCGFTGFVTNDLNHLIEADYILSKMTASITHRGPDDAGSWSDSDKGFYLGFRRLSILELTIAGHQPMKSASGRFIMTFNGEIYNHLILKKCLSDIQNNNKEYSWNGNSDSETLLACFETWGIIETLEKTTGMFAIALWDRNTNTLHLIRDRFGEKPLYYGWINSSSDSPSSFVFGSELKSLRAFPSFNNAIDRNALALYMKFTHVPAPYSIYKNIYKLEAGCIISISFNSNNDNFVKFNNINYNKTIIPNSPVNALKPPFNHSGLNLQRWWSLSSLIERSSLNQILSEKEALEKLEIQLQDTIKMQSTADVPLGAFLSGGVDSSCVAAIMQSQSSASIKTFTIGFEESGFDESPYAKAVANYLGTDHNELFITSKDAQSVVVDLPIIYDEPFADSSQIPTFLLCKFAKQYVSVSLTGDAGDEIFGGYNRYLWINNIWKYFGHLPYLARQILCSAINSVPSYRLNYLGHPINALLPESISIHHLGDRLHKLSARLSGVNNFDELYDNFVSEWLHPGLVVKDAMDELKTGLFTSLNNLSNPLPSLGIEQNQLRMMYSDTMSYLPNDILCKVDRASMANSLETRVPFLDHRIVELAWRLPLNMKLRKGQGKWALRQVLYKYVPKELIERPKVGFAIPLGQWLRGPLKDWAEALLDEKKLAQEGYFYPEPIRGKWLQHLSGRYDHSSSLWTVLMFQVWLQEQNK